jgi:hypothetical protein
MVRRNLAPRSGVPFLPHKRIEDEADLLLAEYGEKFEQLVTPPIPIDEIIELHLQLTFEIGDLREVFGVGDIHGAIWINEGRIAVDRCLDPDANPRKLGRYRFTLAHEVGHWRLHRTYYLKNTQQQGLFDHDDDPSFICRSSDKQPVEWQADAFAANLLMPRKMVFEAWETWQGDLKPLYQSDLLAAHEQSATDDLPARAAEHGDDNAAVQILTEHHIKPLAETFTVSAQAMRIRLEHLKLVLPKKEPSLFD